MRKRGTGLRLWVGLPAVGALPAPAPASVGSDLEGTRAAGALSDRQSRGFRSGGSFRSGRDGAGAVWWNGRTRQSLQLITVDGHVEAISDIGTQPRHRGVATRAATGLKDDRIPKFALQTLAAAGLLPAAPAVAQQTVPVQFARGAGSATVRGTIKGDQFRDYTVNARKGQTMTVTFSNPDGRAYFNLLPPGSNDGAVFVGSISGNSFRGPVPGDGTTTIRVYQMRATARRGESARYTLTIAISGGGQAVSAPWHDARVSGTGFHATGQIRCVAEPGKPMRLCEAGVTRTGKGSGTVQVTTPDGGSRVLTFRDGTEVASDPQAGIDSERRGDTTVVRIGTVEVYEIPDAFILGG